MRAPRPCRPRRFQSTLPARGATPDVRGNRTTVPISIHAPRTGSDEGEYYQFLTWGAFQSTLPARGATKPEGNYDDCVSHFNPRSPHGERQVQLITINDGEIFQSTLPARGATHFVFGGTGGNMISIHAPRTGSDAICRCCIYIYCHFNPRSPHGERQLKPCQRVILCKFQSTLPARGATYWTVWEDTNIVFQSTLPARGATAFPILPALFISISIHAPRTGSDPNFSSIWSTIGISIHAPRTGSDLWDSLKYH
mgnify:CR=1 FL=1